MGSIGSFQDSCDLVDNVRRLQRQSLASELSFEFKDDDGFYYSSIDTLLKAFPYLASLTINQQYISNQNAPAGAKNTKRLFKIKTLKKLTFNRLNSDRLMQFSQVLECDTVTQLTLTNCYISYEVVNIIRGNRVKKLKIHDCKMDLDESNFFKLMQNFPNLTELDLALPFRIQSASFPPSLPLLERLSLDNYEAWNEKLINQPFLKYLEYRDATLKTAFLRDLVKQKQPGFRLVCKIDDKLQAIQLGKEFPNIIFTLC
ncbi:hypothetical protein FGO68_gene1063 [Halteria grandinella]|uniref:Uncharacterized protein n=1 Tax=Halteria grandinella TaxID=5974 RepID=A0A8J8NVJ1_HALGN|nr:hypothetical protein FGO68_gene1063 [Halteria grandinella]